MMIDHWAHFTEFCRYEKRAGGPDPHMALAAHFASSVPEREAFWRLGVYVAVYNVPTAMAIWNRWEPDDVFAHPNELEDWLREHWPFIATRRERRSVRRPQQLASCLYTIARWAMEGTMPASYHDAWAAADRLYAFGRYAKIKLLEATHRVLFLPDEQIPDLRPDGGWSPIEGLRLLYPDDELINESNPRLVNQLAETVRERAGVEGVALDRYEVQVLLCDYKQAWHGRQYPGRSQDSELEYAETVGQAFDVTEMFGARLELFPQEVLGEVRGWNGVRKELGSCLPEHGYVWSDFKFDYGNTLWLGAPCPA